MITESQQKPMQHAPIVAMTDVVKSFREREGGVLGSTTKRIAVDGVSVQVREAETVGIVGESGSGKSTLARLMAGLLAPDAGTVEVGGFDPRTRDRRMRRQVASTIQMVFQDPYSSLNPRLRVGKSVMEPLSSSGRLGQSAAKIRLAEMLDKVGIPASAASRYPHEFSGGQRQRLCIARALILNPKVVILDEAVSALDVSVKSQILNVLKALQQELQTAYVFISHDLGITRQVCRRIAVMLRGQIVEIGPTDDILRAPRHPYTQLLVNSVPKRSGLVLEADRPGFSDQLNVAGCPFVDRCPIALAKCSVERPRLLEIGRLRFAACHATDPKIRNAKAASESRGRSEFSHASQ
jgi:oligopeptide/dipeptide ABC transporter ATP-binding protein